jgi:hypothetical protein
MGYGSEGVDTLHVANMLLVFDDGFLGRVRELGYKVCGR